MLRQQRLDRLADGVELRMLIEVSQRQFGQPRRFGLLRQRAVVVPARQQAVRRRPIALVERPGVAQQRNGVDQFAQPAAHGGIGRQGRALIEQQEVAAFFQPAFQLAVAGFIALQLYAGVHQFFGELRQHPDVDLIDQRPVAEIVVEGVDLHLAGKVAHHAVGAGADRMAGEVRQIAPFARQDHGVHAAQQPGQPVVGAVQMHVDNERRRRGDAFDMREQRL